MESVFKFVGKTHYSNVSFRVRSIISTGLSALVFSFYRYWLLPVNSPTVVHIWKHVFPKESNDRFTVGEFFCTSFYQYYSRHGAQVNKKCHKHVTNAPKGIGLV